LKPAIDILLCGFKRLSLISNKYL